MSFIEIDGKKVAAEAGQMIIEAADNLGVQIPRFCYHKKLSIAANCRMCLVEVEKAPKALPACATPITEGMKVWTKSPKALLAQKAVMEFLLINHPLDCPICDQGGECELQDISMGYGSDVSQYTEGKRVVKDKNLGPLIATDMTRCIQCTRCVRFGTEIAGMRELGAVGRGECMEITTYIEHAVESEVSGNIIDICPVGALTSKPYRFTARGWELTQSASIAPHDCVGSHIFVHSRRDEVMRIVPKENESINEVWLSDRDRFSYEALNSTDRLLQPKMKKNEKWETVSWEEALEHTAKRLLEIGSNIAGLISPSATIEEGYLFQKWLKGLGTNAIEHRLRQQDFSEAGTSSFLFPTLGVSLPELEQQKFVLLVGSDIRREQPILGLKLRKMTQAGGKVGCINPIDVPCHFDVAEKVIPEAGDLVSSLAGVLKAVLADKKTTLPELAKIESTQSERNLAKLLLQTEKPLILLGDFALSHPGASKLVRMSTFLSEATGAKMGFLTQGANAAGMTVTGCIPEQALEKDIWSLDARAYVLLDVDPDVACANGLKTDKKLSNADFIVAFTSFESDYLNSVADVLLPIAPFTEKSGTYINVANDWQTFNANVSPKGESRPAWKVLRVLGNLCNLPEFNYVTTEAILAEVKALETTNSQNIPKNSAFPKGMIERKESGASEVSEKRGGLVRIAPMPLYATDSLVRRASALQATTGAGDAIVRLNSVEAKRLNLKGEAVEVSYQDTHKILFYKIDDTVPNGSVVLASGIKETAFLGGPYSMLTLKCVEG